MTPIFQTLTTTAPDMYEVYTKTDNLNLNSSHATLYVKNKLQRTAQLKVAVFMLNILGTEFLIWKGYKEEKLSCPTFSLHTTQTHTSPNHGMLYTPMNTGYSSHLLFGLLHTVLISTATHISLEVEASFGSQQYLYYFILTMLRGNKEGSHIWSLGSCWNHNSTVLQV